MQTPFQNMFQCEKHPLITSQPESIPLQLITKYIPTGTAPSNLGHAWAKRACAEQTSDYYTAIATSPIKPQHSSRSEPCRPSGQPGIHARLFQLFGSSRPDLLETLRNFFIFPQALAGQLTSF